MSSRCAPEALHPAKTGDLKRRGRLRGRVPRARGTARKTPRAFLRSLSWPP